MIPYFRQLSSVINLIISTFLLGVGSSSTKFSSFIISNCVSKSYSIARNQNEVLGKDFGIIADFNGTTGTDNREAFQNAIDYCSKQNASLRLPKGKILLNSYGTTDADKTHANILQLKSNIRIIGNASTIVIGSFFDDKNFVVFSGFNHSIVEQFGQMENIHFDNITIDFNASKSRMRNDYRLRRGIEFGHTVNGSVSKSNFLNGDILCAVATGYGMANISANIHIFNNKFLNLALTDQNIDHTSVYINSRSSTVKNNRFESTWTRGKLVSCATELHNSDTECSSNSVKGYTRLAFIAATVNENKSIKNLVIDRNTVSITNSAVYLWLEKSTSLSNLKISNNKITSAHVNGFPMLYNGVQSILLDSKEEIVDTHADNIQVTNNTLKITNTIFEGRAFLFGTRYDIINKGNKCQGCKDGLNFY